MFHILGAIKLLAPRLVLDIIQKRGLNRDYLWILLESVGLLVLMLVSPLALLVKLSQVEFVGVPPFPPGCSLLDRLSQWDWGCDHPETHHFGVINGSSVDPSSSSSRAVSA